MKNHNQTTLPLKIISGLPAVASMKQFFSLNFRRNSCQVFLGVFKHGNMELSRDLGIKTINQTSFFNNNTLIPQNDWQQQKNHQKIVHTPLPKLMSSIFDFLSWLFCLHCCCSCHLLLSWCDQPHLLVSSTSFAPFPCISQHLTSLQPHQISCVSLPAFWQSSYLGWLFVVAVGIADLCSRLCKNWQLLPPEHQINSLGFI